MSEIVNDSLKKAAKGTTIALFGMLIYMLLEFITRVLIARSSTQSEYGIFSIGFVLLTFSVVVSCLGLEAGATRYIAFYRGKEDSEKVRGIIVSAVQLSFVASVICFLLFFFASDFLTALFHLEHHVVLRIFAIAVPFAVSLEILAAIFRGFDRVQEKVYFRDVLSNALKLVFVATVVILGYSFVDLIYAYVLAVVVASLAFIIYTPKKLPVSVHGGKPMGKELLHFSLPLLAASTISMIIFQTDTLMLGYFKTTATVGLYNAAHPVSQLVQVFLLSLVLIYVPITSQLYAKKHFDEMRRNYAILTKWIVSATLPFFLILFLFPEAVLNALFGPSSAQASVALALRILALGMFFHVFFGPNAATLIIMGKTKLNLLDSLVGVITNIVLNLLLIPPFGIVGAASAAAVSFVVVNALKSAQIFQSHKIHPFTANYVKPVITSTVLISVIYVLVNAFWIPTTITLAMLIALILLFFALYGFSMLITKSFEEEDIVMFLELEKMAGITESRIERILRKFI